MNRRKGVTNIIQFPALNLEKRIKSRNMLAALVNSTGSSDEITERLVKLVETMDKHNYKISKLELNNEQAKKL